MGKLFLAAEYTELDRESTGDLDAWMVLVDYDFNDKLGAALRISSNEIQTITETMKKLLLLLTMLLQTA